MKPQNLSKPIYWLLSIVSVALVSPGAFADSFSCGPVKIAKQQNKYFDPLGDELINMGAQRYQSQRYELNAAQGEVTDFETTMAYPCRQQGESPSIPNTRHNKSDRISGSVDRKAPAGAPSALKFAVEEFESSGGSGQWIATHESLPQEAGGKPAIFYLIRSLPQGSNTSSSIYLLRSPSSRALLADVIEKQNSPVVLSVFPEATGVQAAVLPSQPIVEEVLRAGKLATRKPLIIVTPTTTTFTLAHENQHWLDYNHPTFLSSLENDLNSFASANSLGKEWVPALSRIVLEIRGHAAHAKLAQDSSRKRLPYMDRAGNIHNGQGSDAEGSYKFEVQQAINYFEQVWYVPAINQLLTKVRPESKVKLINLLSRYDFSDDPTNTVTFRTVLRIK